MQTPKPKIWANLGMPRRNPHIKSPFSVFPSWLYIIIQKIIKNGLAVHKIFKFEK